MDGFKNVYDTRDLTNLQPMLWPEGKQVFNPYTEVDPPADANVKVTGFNFNTNTWQYMEVATPEDVQNQDQQLTDAMMAIAELYEQKLLLEDRIAKLEAIVLPK